MTVSDRKASLWTRTPLVTLCLLGACVADPVVSVGRPCSNDQECGPGTRCNAAAGVCVAGDAAVEPGGDGGADRGTDAGRDTAPDLVPSDTRPWCASGSCDNPTPVCELKGGLCRKCFDHAECVKEGKGAICDQSAGNTCRPCKDAADCQSEGLPPLCSSDGRCTISCTTDQDCQTAGRGDHCDTTQKTCEFCQTDAECQAWGPTKWLVCDKTGTSAKCRGCSSHAECQSLKEGLFCDAGGTCRNSCQSDAECVAAGQQPFCDAATKKCRGCVAHAECGAQGYCALGTCKTGTVSYVKCTATCTGGGAGTAASPFCRLDEAITGPAAIIAVQKGAAPCPGLEIKGASREIHGEPGARIQSSGCYELQIGSKAVVVLSGLTIAGGVEVKDSGTAATLVGNTIGPSQCLGVRTTWGDPTVVLRRNLIWQNAEGGIDINSAFTIENNFIVKNGSAGANFGAARLKPQSAADSFVNNTVAENVTKSGNELFRCENNLQLANSIFWGNTPPTLDNDCVPISSDVEGLSPLTGGNINLDPKFKGGSGPGADPWHLSPTSPCDGKADPLKAPPVDYDDQPRSKTAPDIGADEI
jgi:hypothetical protein